MDIEGVNHTYILLKRFRFPIGNTTRDAIAVSSSSGLTLVSLYTLMVKVAIGQIWTAIVFLGAAYFIRKNPTCNRAAATAGVYNASASQTSVIMLLISYLKPMGGEIWYPILWAVLAVLAIAGTSAASILIPKLLVIGHAAPVNPSAVYYPGNLLNDEALPNNTTLARAFALTVPYFLRAAGQGELTPRNSIVVEQENSTDPNFVRINYNYNVTAAEFGLQHAPGLIFYANGSCYTEYGWLTNSTETGGISTDTYSRWNDSSKQVKVSGNDGGPPFAIFAGNSQITNPGIGNVSYSIVASSAGRPSYTASNDPWYLTTLFNNTFNNQIGLDFLVESGRPALSCWESDIFTYQGKKADEFSLTTFNLAPFASPNNVTPPFLTDVIQSLMTYPIIVQVGIGLGRSNLKSATSSALGHAFNAGTSSIFQDLEFLVMASYVATKNMFVETTRFPLTGRDDIPDVARTPTTDSSFNNSNPLRNGTGDFVITDPGIATLSIQVLIAIPVAMAAAVGAVFLLKYLPSQWRVSHALNATVLYSHLHEREEEKVGKDENWNREGTVAFCPNDDLALIHPASYQEQSDQEPSKGKKKKGYHWLPTSRGKEKASRPLSNDPNIPAASTPGSGGVTKEE
ncbi:hypothetical protein EG329_007926 [Mollisiaceae sp. DMI_Dod_QoI]|nr:hypothetical protein EG329_007926 [Helotiales sp. DMI_Dod_QoI]